MTIAFDQSSWNQASWVGAEGISVEVFDSMWIVVHIDVEQRLVRLEPAESAE